MSGDRRITHRLGIHLYAPDLWCWCKNDIGPGRQLLDHRRLGGVRCSRRKHQTGKHGENHFPHNLEGLLSRQKSTNIIRRPNLYYFPAIRFSISIKTAGKGAHTMYRWITAAIVAILFGAVTQAPQFSLRAASEEPVTGWDRMELDNRVVWVSPTVSLTSADIERADPITMPDGKKAISIELTDGGAEKMRRLSAAQMDKLIAMVLDGKLIWAPRVRSEIGKRGVITGNGENGLDDDTIQRILSSVKQ